MARKRFTAEQIVIKLREAEVSQAQGKTVVQVCLSEAVDGFRHPGRFTAHPGAALSNIYSTRTAQLCPPSRCPLRRPIPPCA